MAFPFISMHLLDWHVTHQDFSAIFSH